MGFLKDLLVREVVIAVAKKVVESWPSDRKPETEPTAAELEAYRRHDEDCREIERRRELKKSGEKARDEFASLFSTPTGIIMLVIGFESNWPLGVFWFLVLTFVVFVLAHSFGEWVGRIRGIGT